MRRLPFFNLMIVKKHLATLLCGLGFAFTALAVPAAPGILHGNQPDGTPIELQLFGDENFSWARSADGYTLLRDAEGYWTVADARADGTIIPTAIRYRGSEARLLAGDIRPGLVIPQEQARNMRRAPKNKLQIDNSFPTKGRHKLLMLLVTFSDKNPSFSREDFSDLMNQENYNNIGSFRDFYLENSYGNLDIETTVTRWVRLPGKYGTYTVDNTPEMIRYALQELASSGEVNLADFDNDGDGVLDGLAVIHQGSGQEATGSTLDIWSHSSIMYGLNINGIEVRRYTIEPELYGRSGQISTIGVVCHEFGHNLGAPDFYDTDYSGSGGEYPGTGEWDLMGSGAWNGQAGERPAGINMWQKIQYGWLEPEVLSESKSVNAMPNSTQNPVAYRFDTCLPGDYFIIENRQQTGPFDSALPNSGLLVYHANEEGIARTVEPNTVNATYPQYMYAVSAQASGDPSGDPGSYGSMTYATFPYDDKNEFCDNSFPSTRSFDGRSAYRGLHNIVRNGDGTMSFDFTVDETPEQPANLTSRLDKGVVTLIWEFDGFDDLEYFTIYRNGTEIAQTADTSYIDDTPDLGGFLTYQVDATHKSGKISPYANVSLRIPTNKITDLQAEAVLNAITLKWNVEPKLSRITEGSNDYNTVEYEGASKIEYAHRYRVNELVPYKGYKIRYIHFVPFLSKAEASYTVKVYEAEPGGTNPVCVSSRQCKEFGTRIWNKILLSKTVEITGDKEIWIAVEMVSNLGNVQTLTDFDLLTPGLGNWVNIDDAGWGEDELADGNFLLYASLNAADETEERPLAEFTDVFNPVADLFYPLGFSVYRDGEYIGSCSSRMFVDRLFSTGMHTYTVASLYPGNNESSVSEVAISGEQTGILATFDDVASMDMRVLKGGIIVDDKEVNISIYTSAGATVYNGPNTGRFIALTPGMYIVRVANRVAKIMVK